MCVQAPRNTLRSIHARIIIRSILSSLNKCIRTNIHCYTYVRFIKIYEYKYIPRSHGYVYKVKTFLLMSHVIFSHMITCACTDSYVYGNTRRAEALQECVASGKFNIIYHMR